MRKFFGVLFFVFLSFSIFAQTELYNKLVKLPNVVSVKEMNVKPYKEYYEIYFKQNIDNADTTKGFFNQRVLLGHVGYNAPVVVELQGYDIWSSRQGELSRLFNANQLTIEHRFFKDSKPEGDIPWKDLTVRKAAADQHIVIEAIKTLYSDCSWISTGISKGGQTTIIHHYFYPNDVDVAVPYVAPHNLSREDPRIHSFLNTVGDKSTRKKILAFQKLSFKNIDDMLPLMEEFCAKSNYSFKIIGGIKRALELTILEYSFAFWQWGSVKEGDIPTSKNSLKQIFRHLVRFGDPSFFEDSSIERQRPYFWAAMTEMGIYDYDIKPFKRFLKDRENISFDFTMPRGFENTPFDGSIMHNISDWLQKDASNMIFIYGGLDTWGSTAVNLGNNDKCKKYVMPTGHHGTRILSFSSEIQSEIKNSIMDMINK